MVNCTVRNWFDNIIIYRQHYNLFNMHILHVTFVTMVILSSLIYHLIIPHHSSVGITLNKYKTYKFMIKLLLKCLNFWHSPSNASYSRAQHEGLSSGPMANLVHCNVQLFPQAEETGSGLKKPGLWTQNMEADLLSRVEKKTWRTMGLIIFINKISHVKLRIISKSLKFNPTIAL